MKGKGQYFMLFGLILLISIFYFLLTYNSAPISYEKNTHVDEVLERDMFYNFSLSLPLLSQIIHNFHTAYDEGIITISKIDPINDTHIQVRYELYNYGIDGEDLNITINTININASCFNRYCSNNSILFIPGREINVTINLKYFMDNEIILFSKNKTIPRRRAYAYYFALKEGEKIMAGSKII